MSLSEALDFGIGKTIQSGEWRGELEDMFQETLFTDGTGVRLYMDYSQGWSSLTPSYTDFVIQVGRQ